MPRKKNTIAKSLPAIVYRYGAGAPIMGAEQADEQFLFAHRYRNTLTEIQLARMACSTDWLKQIAPDYAQAELDFQAAEAEIDRVYERVGKLRQQARKRVKLPPEIEAELKAAKAARKAASIRRGVAKAALLHRLSPELARLEPQYRARVEGLSAKHVKSLLTEDAELRELAARLEQARKAANAEIYGEVSREFNELQKAARADASTYWGTYLLVEEAMEKSAQSGRAPRFLSWRGEGRLGVQIQSTNPLTVEGALACQDSRVRLQRVIEAPSPKHYRLWLRIGSDAKRQPVWCVVPLCFHRPMPLAADIANVYLTRRKVATDYRYHVCFVLKQAAGWQKPCAPAGRVAVDVGHRLAEGGLRVAYWKGDDEAEGQLLIPDQDGPQRRFRIARPGGKAKYVKRPDDRMGQYANCAVLRSRRDVEFNLARDALADWIDKQGESLPDWLTESVSGRRKPPASRLATYVDGWLAKHRENCWQRAWLLAWRQTAEQAAAAPQPRQTLRQWRSSARLAALVMRWQRFAGDEPIFERLEAWRKHDKHLYLWQEHERRAFLDWRLNHYRTFAASLRKRYAVVVLEDLDLREMAKRPKPDEAAKAGALDEHRTIAALGILLTALKQSGMRVELRPAPLTTMRHAECGHVSHWDDAARARRIVTCEGCGKSYDQDANACDNLLASGDVVDAVS